MTVRITWRGDEWAKAIQPAINAGVTAAARTCADHAAELLSGPSPSPAGSPPGVDTDHLRGSIAFCSPESLGTPGRAAYGTAVEYGRHLEFGAVVRPKSAKALAIPNDRAAGRFIFKRNKPGEGLRSNANLKFIPLHGKSGLVGVLVNKRQFTVNFRGPQAKYRKIPPESIMFYLRSSAKIRARPWLRRSAIEARPAASAAFAVTTKERLVAAGLVKP